MTNRQLAQENVPANEAAVVLDLAERLKQKIIGNNPTGPMRRDAHSKMHGVVRAEFIVESGLPEELRVGLFREPGRYRAWIRFSNQFDVINPDRDKDIRGMAIKLMGVPGAKLLEEERDAQTQDFLLISTPVFVTRDVEQFAGLVEALMGGLLAKLWYFATHWRVALNLWKSMQACEDPLATRYFSTTPYLFGATAAKYSAIPHAREAFTADRSRPDYLRDAMVRRLAREDVEFDFAVQLQTDPASMPIEDPGRAWSEAASPFRKVATVRIPRQEFDSEAQRDFGENLSFTPWHCLPEHRPLGGINRARKLVYRFISTFRHRVNHAPRREPDSWDITQPALHE